jgi:hypothetical protein
MTLDFFQIIFDEKQKESLYPFAKPYFNTKLTDYFENSVLCDLVPNSQADLISVCSWRLAQKRGDMSRLTDKTLTEEKILNADFDIAILTPRHPNHKPLLMADEWHTIYDQSTLQVIARPWRDAFEVFKPFLKSIGINVPEELKYAIYENHFIAKRAIYQVYVKEVLTPAIEFIRARGQGVFTADSGYIYKKRNAQEVKAYQEKSGRTDWPISVFLLERLFSIFIEGKNYKVINL